MRRTISPQMFLVVDDHDTVLGGTLSILEKYYPSVIIRTAQTANNVRDYVDSQQPNLLLFDLSIPEHIGEEAKIDIGLQCLREVMEQWPDLNITVQSSYIKALARLVHEIDNHDGGFTVAHKNLPVEDMLMRIDWALQGVTYTKDIEGMRVSGAMRPEWYRVLKLAFSQGLQDGAIAQEMNRAERTIRVYWSKIYDVLGIYPENGKSLRIQTEMRARELGLID